jgi:hypothetical protein
MKDSNELITYLTDTVSLLKQVKQTMTNRNKTKRIKALSALCDICLNLADSKLKYARAGGYNEFNAFVVQEIFNPILEYFAEEAIK